MVDLFQQSFDPIRAAIDFFYGGRTCSECDSIFRLQKGTTHDLIVEVWRQDKEEYERKRAARKAGKE